MLLASPLHTDLIAFCRRLGAVAQDLTGVLAPTAAEARHDGLSVNQTRTALLGRPRNVAARGGELVKQLASP